MVWVKETNATFTMLGSNSDLLSVGVLEILSKYAPVYPSNNEILTYVRLVYQSFCKTNPQLPQIDHQQTIKIDEYLFFKDQRL